MAVQIAAYDAKLIAARARTGRSNRRQVPPLIAVPRRERGRRLWHGLYQFWLNDGAIGGNRPRVDLIYYRYV